VVSGSKIIMDHVEKENNVIAKNGYACEIKKIDPAASGKHIEYNFQKFSLNYFALINVLIFLVLRV